MPEPVVIRSYAKVNFFLDIICKRKDGYHNIETVFQSVNLHDEMSLQLIPSGLEVQCSDPSVPSDPRNLAAKAVLALRKLLNFSAGIRIEIHKSIPVGAGLGGGSSNAAAALVGLNRLFHDAVPAHKLQEIARSLGADVPFFLGGGLAAGWGIGDRLLPLPCLPESFLVIAVPVAIQVSTALAYAKVNAPECEALTPDNFSQCGERLKGFVDALHPSASLSRNGEALRFLYNELEEVVFSLFPEIAFLKKAMLKAGAKAALMSGSGSAVFGLAESAGEAETIQKKLEASFGCRCFVTSTNSVGCD